MMIKIEGDLKAEIRPHIPAATALFHVDSFIGGGWWRKRHFNAGELLLPV